MIPQPKDSLCTSCSWHDLITAVFADKYSRTNTSSELSDKRTDKEGQKHAPAVHSSGSLRTRPSPLRVSFPLLWMHLCAVCYFLLIVNLSAKTSNQLPAIKIWYSNFLIIDVMVKNGIMFHRDSKPLHVLSWLWDCISLSAFRNNAVDCREGYLSKGGSTLRQKMLLQTRPIRMVKTRS